MSVSKSEPTVVVTCHDCGTTRTITVSYQRRLTKEGRLAPCEPCKRFADTEPGDDDLWFWLEAYGVERNGISSAEHIQRYGMPEALAAMIDTIRP